MELLDLDSGGAPAHFLLGVQRSADRQVTLLGAGRGLTRDAAIASCVGEAIERMAAARPTPELIVCAPECNLPRSALQLGAIWQFSVRQLLHGPHESERPDAKDWIRGRVLLEACNHWCAARDRTGQPAAFVPAAAALLDDSLPFSCSNGLAAGRNRREAERAAVLELVERDAVAIWWFGRCLRPEVPLTTLDLAGGASLRQWLGERERWTSWT